MADEKITQFTEATSLTSTDIVPVVTNVSTTPTSNKATITTVKNAVAIKARPKFSNTIHRPLFLPPNFSVVNYTTAQYFNGGIEFFPVWLPSAAHITDIAVYVIAGATSTATYLEYYEADEDYQISGAAKISGDIDASTEGLKTVTADIDVAAGAGWLVLGHNNTVEVMGWAVNTAWARNDISNDRFIKKINRAYAARSGTLSTIASTDLTYGFNPNWAMGVTLLVDSWL